MLKLYKQLITKRLAELRYTDKDFYRNCMRNEFRKYMNVESQKERQRHLDKGYFFLEGKHGKLL